MERFGDFTATLESLIVTDISLFTKIIKSRENSLTERQLGNLASSKKLCALRLILDFRNESPFTITKDYPDRISYKASNMGKCFTIMA